MSTTRALGREIVATGEAPPNQLLVCGYGILPFQLARGCGDRLLSALFAETPTAARVKISSVKVPVASLGPCAFRGDRLSELGAMMGFDELAGDDPTIGLDELISEVMGTIAAGTVEIQQPPAASVGTISVTLTGELFRLDLSPAAAFMKPSALGRAIEEAYPRAHNEVLRRLDLALTREAQDASCDPVLLHRITALRARYTDLSGLKKLVRSTTPPSPPTVEQRYGENPDADEWNPAADPLQRRRRR